VDGRDVADYLNWLGTERIGMESNPSHDAEVVETLLQWRNHLIQQSR